MLLLSAICFSIISGNGIQTLFSLVNEEKKYNKKSLNIIIIISWSSIIGGGCVFAMWSLKALLFDTIWCDSGTTAKSRLIHIISYFCRYYWSITPGMLMLMSPIDAKFSLSTWHILSKRSASSRFCYALEQFAMLISGVVVFFCDFLSCNINIVNNLSSTMNHTNSSNIFLMINSDDCFRRSE